MVKMVICADTHLNAYYAKMRPEQLEKRREYLRNAFKSVVDFAIEKKVDIFLHAGDLFDMPDPRYLELLFVFRELMRLKEAGIKTFMIGGTHDIPKARFEAGGAASILIYEIGQVARVFRGAKIQSETINVGGKSITIAGISCDPRIRDGNPLEGLEFHPDNSDFTIFMFHYAIEGRIPQRYEGAVVTLHWLRQFPADLFIAGHLHPHANFDLERKSVIIPGATERFDFGEEKNDCGFYYLQLTDKPKIEYQKISAQPMQNIEIHSDEIIQKPKGERLGYLLSRIKEVSHPEKLLKCKLIGEIENDVLMEVPFNQILEEGNKSNFFFDLDWQGLKIKRGGFEGSGEGPTNVEEEMKSVARSIEEEEELVKEALDLALSKWREAR
ncbi:DNA repair exonuclease [bacterium]|nr:DNA repair exonuclease [bacterium]